MNSTTSLCNTCYREIPAVVSPFNDPVPMIYKACDQHGLQRGKLEGDWEFFSTNNTYERHNHYKVLIINVTNHCNIACKYCYYPCDNSSDMSLEQFKETVGIWRSGVSTFIISGGDPTCWPHYFEAAEWCRSEGIMLSQLTNGVKFADEKYWNTVIGSELVYDKCLLAEMSIHPANITSETIRAQQISVLHKLRAAGLRLSCIMMNIDTKQHSATELDDVMDGMIEFMREWRDVTLDFRIRPICGSPVKYYLSDIVKSLRRGVEHKGLTLKLSNEKDVDNIYNQNFRLDGISLVTVCAADLSNIDIGYLNRGPYMLANDGRPYSVPHAILINQGIDEGWYAGRRIAD